MSKRMAEVLLCILGGSLGILVGGFSYSLIELFRRSGDEGSFGIYFLHFFLCIVGLLIGIYMENRSKIWSIALGVCILLGFIVLEGLFAVPGILFSLALLLSFLPNPKELEEKFPSVFSSHQGPSSYTGQNHFGGQNPTHGQNQQNYGFGNQPFQFTTPPNDTNDQQPKNN